MARAKILLVEDEESISEPLAAALEREGFSTEVAATASDALAQAAANSPDAILLDVMLPDGDGRDVLRSIRSSSAVPIIMLTARGEEMDRIVGLELGADDYIAKPFSAREVVARIRAVLRRVAPPSEGPARLAAANVVVDLDTRAAIKDGEKLELTLKEFDLLRFLVENAGRVVTREEIIDEVWDPHWFGPTKTLDVHISSLRKKLGDSPAAPRYIHTVRGVGFRFTSSLDAPG